LRADFHDCRGTTFYGSKADRDVDDVETDHPSVTRLSWSCDKWATSPRLRLCQIAWCGRQRRGTKSQYWIQPHVEVGLASQPGAARICAVQRCCLPLYIRRISQ
jgi:hypothetical protein